MSPTFDPTDLRSLARRAEVYALAFTEAGDALASQERRFAELRGRGAVLVATAAITTSLFGGPALGEPQIGIGLGVAIPALVGVCFCVLALQWPRDLLAATDAGDLIPRYSEPGHVPLAFVHRELALHRAESFARNQAQLDRMTRLSRVALVLLAIEIVAWVASYASTL